jgi:hypothetical protein
LLALTRGEAIMRPYIAVSYHYDSDIDFVRKLSAILQDQGLGCWYLETVTKKRRPWQDYAGGQFDWQEEPQNWLATFLEHLLSARGVIVVLSPHARESHQTEGRGMWKERPAIAFIREDDSKRVLEIERFDPDDPAEKRIAEIVRWAQGAITLPEVNRLAMTGEVAASFNTPTGVTGPVQLPERKTRNRDWCEIVRLDLYDGQWQCRRCGLKSWNYILAHENPPIRCPGCGYMGEIAESTKS